MHTHCMPAGPSVLTQPLPPPIFTQIYNCDKLRLLLVGPQVGRARRRPAACTAAAAHLPWICALPAGLSLCLAVPLIAACLPPPILPRRS